VSRVSLGGFCGSESPLIVKFEFQFFFFFEGSASGITRQIFYFFGGSASSFTRQIMIVILLYRVVKIV